MDLLTSSDTAICCPNLPELILLHLFHGITPPMVYLNIFRFNPFQSESREQEMYIFEQKFY